MTDTKPDDVAALGYKHHVEQLRAATASGVVRMNDTADLIEAQAAQIAALTGAVEAEHEACANIAGLIERLAMHMEGRLPVHGWLRDNDRSRALLDALVNSAAAIRQRAARG